MFVLHSLHTDFGNFSAFASLTYKFKNVTIWIFDLHGSFTLIWVHSNNFLTNSSSLEISIVPFWAWQRRQLSRIVAGDILALVAVNLLN